MPDLELLLDPIGDHLPLPSGKVVAVGTSASTGGKWDEADYAGNRRVSMPASADWADDGVEAGWYYLDPSAEGARAIENLGYTAGSDPLLTRVVPPEPVSHWKAVVKGAFDANVAEAERLLVLADATLGIAQDLNHGNTWSHDISVGWWKPWYRYVTYELGEATVWTQDLQDMMDVFEDQFIEKGLLWFYHQADQATWRTTGTRTGTDVFKALDDGTHPLTHEAPITYPASEDVMSWDMHSAVEAL